jgi:uncharacterized membrane protein YeiH
LSTQMIAASLVSTASVLASVGASVASSATTSPSGIAALVETTVPQAVASVLPSAVTTTAALTTSQVTIPPVLEVSAAFAGALAGGLVAVERRFDVVGVVTIAIVAGLGGGMIRDVLLQKYGIYALESPRLLVTVLIAAVIAFFFASAAKRATFLLFLIDALALGLFAVAGSDKALLAGLAFIPAILVGTITSTGGGMLRDVLVGEVPQVLRPGGVYATASASGAILYVLLVGWLDIVKPVATVLVVVLVLALRLVSQWRGWSSPTPVDLTPRVAAMPGKTIGAITSTLRPSRDADTSGSSVTDESQSAEQDEVEPGVGPPE